MKYDIFDSTGNLVDSFDVEVDAREALERMARADSSAAEHLALITFDDEGIAVGEAVFAHGDSEPLTAPARASSR
jgi:hypothetical protein